MYRNAPFKPPRLGQLNSSPPTSLKRPLSSSLVNAGKKFAKTVKPKSAPSLFVEEDDAEVTSQGEVIDVPNSPIKPSSDGEYPIQWRKKSAKKNKSWEGDGHIVLKANGLTIYDEDDNLLGKKSIPPHERLDLKEVIAVGIYEVEIDDIDANQSEIKSLPKARAIGASQSIQSLPKGRTIVPNNQNNSQSLQSRTTAPAMNSPPVSQTTKYYVQWRKKSNKKNKSWEGDGFLSIGNKIMTLKDDDGNLLSKKTIQPTDNVDLTAVIPISVYEVEISEEIVTEKPESVPAQKKSQRIPSQTLIQKPQIQNRITPPGLAESQTTVKNENSTRTYTIQWRKKTNKKNKTWEGDGVVVASTINGTVTLTAKSLDQKVLGKKTFGPTIPPSFLDTVFPLGGIEFEIDEDVNGEDSTSQNDDMSMVSPQVENTPFKPVMAANNAVEVKSRQQTPEIDSTSLYTNPKSIELPKFDGCKVDVSIDSHLSVHLRPHQIEGVKFLYECVMGFRNFKGHGCLLADEMGLGKTLMTITLIWTLLKQSPFIKGPSINKILIVCPVTLINNWVNEFKKWLGNNKVGILTLAGNGNNDRTSVVNFARLNVYQVLIINYEKVGTYFEELSNVPFDLLICDEGHRLKTSSNKVLNHLTNLKIPKQVLLTGTPIQNDLVEFYTIINFINPGILGEFKRFQKVYINTIVKSRDVHCFDTSLKQKGVELSNELIKITQEFILRRTQSILSKYLTDKTDTIIFVPPTPLQTKLFDFILNLPTFTQEVGNSNQAFTLINLFKKLCNSPSLLSNDKFYTAIEDDKKDFQLTTSSGKINILIPLLLEITSLKEKIVLISNYTKTLNLLELILKKLNLQFIRLDGSTPNNMRSKLVNAFNKTPSIHVFLLSSKSGGMGINLVGASRLILFDNDWNPAVDLQSMSRIHRDGQKKQCYIYRIMTTGCIDEKIFQRQLMKNNLSSTFLDNESKRNDNVFDEFEMKKLFEIDYTTRCNTHDLLDCDCGGMGDEKIAEVDVTVEDEDEEEGKLQSGSWISAKELMEHIDENELEQATNKKSSMRNALSGYIHFDPKVADPTDLKDQVLANIIQNQNFKEVNGKPPISFIFSKPTNKEDVNSII